jgi:5-methylcytosine-specific restriction endonuclease McrA
MYDKKACEKYRKAHHETLLERGREYKKVHHEERLISNALYRVNKHAERQASYKAYLESHREERKAYDKARRLAIRTDVLKHYGGKCVCCGTDIPEFLAMDHIDGGGYEHRKLIRSIGASFYTWIQRNHYPDNLQILCHNCNQAKGFYGQCPHERMRNEGK